MKHLVKMTLVVCIALSGVAYASNKANKQTRDLYEFIAAQGTFCADLFNNGECMMLNPPLENLFSWSDPKSFRMAYFDYSGVADRAFNGRFGAQFDGKVTETKMDDGRGFVQVSLRTKNAISWAYIRDPFNPLSQPEEQLFGHWITSTYSVKDGFVRGESVFHIDFVIPEFGGEMPDLIEWAYRPPAGAEIRTVKFKGCAVDADNNLLLKVHQETDQSAQYFIEDVLVEELNDKMAYKKGLKPNKQHSKLCKKYLR
ncbi:hypothetical protein [Paraglaciecola aestuariivivens]